MFLKIKITPTALSDLQEAITYYNQQQQGLGKKFKDEVQKIFKQLSKVPAREVLCMMMLDLGY